MKLWLSPCNINCDSFKCVQTKGRDRLVCSCVMADLLEYTPEQRVKRILTRKMVQVTEQVKGCVSDFNDRLLAEALVASGLYDPNDIGVRAAHAASALYQACITTVSQDPSKFSTLLSILSNYPNLDKVVKEMRSQG